MSKMGLLRAIGFSLALVSFTQILHSAEAQSGCEILTTSSSTASSILVKWKQYPGATSYLLDLRKKNSPGSVPVVTSVPGHWTEKNVRGLSPGTEYKVTLKVFMFYFVECVNSTKAITVPDSSQIIVSRPLTSTSFYLKWMVVPSAQYYYLEVYSKATGDMVSFTYTNTTAVVENLRPSTYYNCFIYTANQAGLGSRSKLRTVSTLVQPPVGIVVTQTDQGSARITWQPVKDVLRYQVKISDLDEPGSQPSVYDISGTMLDLHGILPCSNYLISVSSFSKFLVPSEPTDHTYSTNKLTPVTSVSVDYSCTTNSVKVSWSTVFGADFYKASAKGENGTVMTCTSTGTSCQIFGLGCGQNYVVHVTPVSENCENTVNATSATFYTVDCPPSDLTLVRECSKDVISFSWSPTDNADHYYAAAVDSKGRVHPCLTQDTFCNFTHVACGRHYDFTVYSISGGCQSNTSSTVSIRTAPCIPQNLRASANCSSDVLLSTWDLADGALHYTVRAIGNRRNSSYSCTSLSNSCAMEGVKCGEHLSINITAFDSECTSQPTLGLSAETVPCPPHKVSATKECGTDSIGVSWHITGAALFFVATAKDSNGTVHSCNSFVSSCKIDGLKCSTHYNVSVIASNLMCTSTESETVTIETAPCPPHTLVASLDCLANEALISWHGQPEMNSYTATVVDEEHGLLSCSSTTTSCKIPNLKCGQLYTVTVSHHDGVCPSMPSEPIYMDSVPCGPANMHVDLNCESGDVEISWSETTNAEGYMAVISDSGSHVTLNSTEPELSVTTLECGKEYTVRVKSFEDSCVSFPSELTVREAPCVPAEMVAKRNCSQSFVEVTWMTSRGADNYSVTAVNEHGDTLECVSSETWCRLEGVMCSKVYNISVAAVDDACTSMRSPAVMLQTEPCAPTQLMASVDCRNNSARLTWNSSPNAAYYTGRAVSSDGHSVTCDPGMTLGCSVEGLNCGKEYTFTVSASDGECQSAESDAVVLTTAPCTVSKVENSLNCITNVLTVSWTSGSMPVNHSVTAMAAGGATLSCLTEESWCELPELQCGAQYTVMVTPISHTCEGPSSDPIVVNSVPCVPMDVHGMVECSTNTLQTSWAPAGGAVSYISTLMDAEGSSLSCNTANQSCLFSTLQCAQTYTFSVVALNDNCRSTNSTTISATTAPCDPTNVSASLNCDTGVATVTWKASAGAVDYTVIAESSGHVDSCNSPGVSCELTRLHCGEHYTVTVMAGDSKCNSSVFTATNLTTAPCPPVIKDHSLDCSFNNATVTWAHDEDAMSVTITATSSLGHSQSCSSSNHSCVLDDLQCGHTYTVEAFAQGVQCLSKPSASFQIVTAPCTPANVEFQYSCGTGITFINWDETLGRESFYIYAEAGDHMSSCSTTETNCPLSSLLCSRLYDVKVIAVAAHCNSSTPGVTQIQTAPCAPVNVGATLVCDNNTAEVSWDQSPGAMTYSVMASGRDGDVKRCTANDTTCWLPNMHCAEVYTIVVTPFSNNCQGQESDPYSYTAGPCPPTDVQVSLQCIGNVGHVTWTRAPHADLYVATAVTTDVDDHIYNCSSTGLDCSLTDLHCGETAVVTVVTIERGCMSIPSIPVTFNAVICPPTGLTGETTCSNNDITVTWDPSPESGVKYFVHSREDGGVIANYSTTQTSQIMTGLQCGHTYTLTVAASDSECTSVFSEPIQTGTAPCPPTSLTVKTECGTNTATLAWAESVYATSYTAVVTGNHGHITSCSTNSTLNCSMTVDCGHQYTGVVIASSTTCDSSASAPLTFNSAPCLPDNVKAEVDCNANSFAVQWRGSVDDVGTYTALAIGSDGTRETCDSSAANCTIENLRCGLTYGIVVTTSSVDCGVIEGSNYKMQTAPCKPDNVMVDLQCSTNVALVTWGNSGPDQTQEVTAFANLARVTTTCHSNGTNCTFDELTCGERYTISVTGHTETCSSEATPAEEFNTAPCVPTHLTARVDCNTGITVVTWDSALGATSYTAYAQGSLGHNAECTSADTNCDFLNLACGQDYNITVVASHDSCVSLVSETITATTGPCPHRTQKPELDCNTNTAVVSWTPGSGILYYNASADGFTMDHTQTCSTSNYSCNITSLHCGESYKVSVTGQGRECSSPAQDWHRVNTAPCPPTQLNVVSSCESNNILVSWQASQGSVSYTAIAENAEGLQWSCDTSSNMCEISGLSCGQEYNVYAVGIDEHCAGARSDMEVIHTAPCVPENIQNDLDCVSGVLNVTWESTGHFVHFRASVISSEGDVSICNTSEHHCVVRNMQCGLTYGVMVAAEDEACNSSYSPVKNVSTAPCPLSSFVPTVDCDTGSVSVTWTDGVDGVMYTVSAVDTLGSKHNCSGADNGCDLTTLECGTQYNVTITPSRDGCVGRNTATKMITTVPCVSHLLDVEIDCLANSAWAIYNESAGAESYVVIVTDIQGEVQTFECNSASAGMCALPPLPCSQNLTFTMKAQDQQCSSAPSNAVKSETAPCPPENVTQSVDCDNQSISVHWSAIPGAISYKATLEEMAGGNTTCCTTSNTSCDITDLPCGQMYILHVVAEGRTCNSSESEGRITRTAACTPENLTYDLSCSNNVASMSWRPSEGGQLYTVTAVAPDGHMHECTSPLSQCDLTDLHCGEYYTATVTAEDADCRSKPSDSVTIKTVPCTPENTSSVMDCETNSLIVSWSESEGADSYIATLQDSIGQTTTCQGTTEGSCSVPGVGCGQIYHIQVVASDGLCESPPTPEMTNPTVPCQPRNIEAVMDCHTHTGLVSWSPSDGASWYIVTASTVSGHSVTCESNSTNCDLESLLCGQSYVVSVKAVGDTCSFLTNMTGELVTEPCIPERITTRYSVTIGQVQWDMTAGASYYTVVAETEQGLVTSCNSTDTYCALYGMKCGQMYNVTVTANNDVCQDMSSSTKEATILTEPCPPRDVQTNVNCQENHGTVSWEASWGAVGYMAHLAGRDGHSLSCYTYDTFCSVAGLHCGVIYHTSVIALGEMLNSSSSITVLLTSAPCTATNIASNLDCDNNTVTVSWSSASGANSYTVSAMSADGYLDSCETDGHQCDLSELECGQVYNVTLTINSDTCQMETPSNEKFITRPCKPLRVGVDLRCGTSTAVLHWEQREDVELYVATATRSSGVTLQYNSTGSTCQFSELDCGETYEFSVTAYSDMCYSEVSSTVEIQTEPCQPTGLTANGMCNNDTVELEWSKSKGAMNYVVTASGDLGYIETFRTSWPSLEAELPCGQVYNFTVVAHDDRCESAVSMYEQYKTGPCIPQHVEGYIHCEDSLGAISWATSDGADSYLAVAVGLDGHTHECTSNTTTCIWEDLHCGEQYTIHVIANDYLCTSMPSNSSFIRMAPCRPQNLTSSFNCSTKVGSLAWNASETAEFYVVTAENNSGHKVQLSTNDTWTFISEFQCGQNYTLSVRAVDSECTSEPSQPSVLESEPCPPTGVSSYMNCVADIAVVSWTASAGAEFYTATVMMEDGRSKSCWSDSERCSLPNIYCGQNFTVTVVASNKKCDSDPSEPDTLRSVPCVPTDVDVDLDCTTNRATVSWMTSDPAFSYKVTAESSLGHTSMCETSELRCTLTNLTCGHNYTVAVVAEDDVCTSLPSSPVTFNSVPCIPSMGSIVLDCYTNSALLDWSYADGAVSYTATARSSNGNESTCTSNITSCELAGLRCGQVYDVVTVASNEQCSSPPSASLPVASVPCPPEDVIPTLDCSTNTARVAWRASPGADSYIVQAFGILEHETGCETELQSCILPDLMCGFTYNVSVIAVNSVCNVSHSQVKTMQAVPCIPQQVEAQVACESGFVAASWEPSKGALSYTAVAQGNGGYASVCNSNQTTCLFNDLMCGHNYTVTVRGLGDTCSSGESPAVDVSTVPCVPQRVTAAMTCSNDTGVIVWEEGEGVSSYKVQAVGPDGHRVECYNDESSCDLPSMHCGQLYNVTVTAEDGVCNNSRAHLTLQSVPCKPTSVKAALRCSSNSAAVTWEQASGARSYVAVGVTADGAHRTTCNNNLTYCDLSDLQCGQTYNVSVFARDGSCSSVESDSTSVRTAPCVPQNVNVEAQCAEEAMVVSWAANPDAQYFHVAAVSNTGVRLSCDSMNTSCVFSNLPCGQNYNVTVLSVREDCESKTSVPVATSSAPCVPRSPQGHLDCVTNSAFVTFDDSNGATGYFVLAQAANGLSSNCTSTSSPCNVPDLECGTLYTFHVYAVNKQCRSNDSSTFELETGPCTLRSIMATTECNSDAILVEWEQTLDTPLYLVTAEDQDQNTISCNSSSNSCLLEDIGCGRHYSIIVSASSDKCSSLRSPPKKINTAPCIPNDVTVTPSCEENGVTVAWGHSSVAKSYQLTATGFDGHVATCDTSLNNCSLADLHCGQTYSVNITARGSNCTSQPSTTSFRTGPCAPSGLAVDLDCQANSASLSWDSSDGAVEYFSCAQPLYGDALYCDNTVPSCTFTGLECGQMYNFSVTVSNGVCNSSFSAPLQAGAAPCPPSHLYARVQKISDSFWVMASWDQVNCTDVEYLVAVTGHIQNDPQKMMEVSSYWLPRPYFEIPVPCSTTFNATVTSRNSVGESEPSRPYTGLTAPCAPQNVAYTGTTESAVLSWDASALATNYTVYDVSGGSRVVLCSTAGLTCTLTNLNPNATEVTASNASGEGNPSQTVTGPGGSRRRRDLRTAHI